ncbi:glycoside hydrolase family 15 protein [Sorangium sp. So ce1335]|uniref:glycoside hydrolase family 15 protein n=1 Tax=Sorangium sp. So ce1335 TaxID=3133335 RepID=UPI003F6074DC
MPLRIEDYALIGDTQTAALVGRDGSIDWLCLPRFDSGASFAALLGAPEHGRFKIAPKDPAARVRRRYREGTLVLETEFTTAEGAVRVIDCMPLRGRAPDVVRVVEGVRGRVPVSLELVIRFDHGSIVPWVRSAGGALRAVGGPDALILRAGVPVRGAGLTTVADFDVREGERVPFVLTWYPSHEPPPEALDADREVAHAEAWWRAWSSRCTHAGPWRGAVVSSLIALKALTHAPTGGLVAAPTTSLPEQLGGVRNWDYRYCWLRDATLTLYALLLAGYSEEAAAWRDWLLRAIAGDPSKLQILYGIAGERRLREIELPWLPGYEGSRPVRVGNAAVEQLQLDVYGEVMDTMYQARRVGLPPEPEAWRLQRKLMDFLESSWRRPDEGIWEVRGGPRAFTYSRVMAWVAFDRAVKSVEQLGLEGPVDRWRALRGAVHAEVCEKGFDRGRGTFTQSYGSQELDASTLLIPLVGFLPPDDPRVAGTVRAIERELLRGGFVLRYPTGPGGTPDGLPGDEGVFLACSFWLADCYALMGRAGEARALFERLLALRNDVGLLSEEYDPASGRLLGNFPQAFSHLALVGTAFNLSPDKAGPAGQRSR